jgi:hypothetical protein
MAAMSDYLENKLVDFLFRGQAFVPPANLYMALFTVAATEAGAATEVVGGNYARVAIASNMNNWSGTQGSASTVASSGTSGTTSNNGNITFPTPSALWGTVVATGIFDAPTGGNLLFHTTLATNKTINNGDPAPFFSPASVTAQLDN